MKQTLESNGKPSAINLITENDNKFLKHLERQARKEALAAQVAERSGTANPEESSKELDQTHLTEEEKAKAEVVESESEEDEVGALIEKEEQEARRAEKEAAEQKVADEEAEKDRILKDKRDAEKLEKIREQERDLLDKRS